MNDNVNHPVHYTNRGIECIQVTEMFNFNRGNAIKYIWRAGEKSKDTEIEDLRKAIWYLEREVKRLCGPQLNVWHYVLTQDGFNKLTLEEYFDMVLRGADED